MHIIGKENLTLGSLPYDLIVVGSGFSGSVIAHMAAEECGWRVLVVERRGHIAGNMFDEVDENGVLVQRFGPHVFHTDQDWIYRFICRFSEWRPYSPVSAVEIDGKNVTTPFGFRAIRTLYPAREAEELIAKMRRTYPECESVPVMKLLESPDTEIASFARLLYEKDYRPYAAKQWNLEPYELDPSVLERMPVILSERENYFDIKYVLLPERGFTEFFRSMLSHRNIDVILETDIFELLDFDFAAGQCMYAGEKVTVPIVYTGALERFFESEKPLPYRSLYYDYRTFEKSSYQPYMCMAHPLRHEYLRTIEYKKMMDEPPKEKTTVAFEYPVPYEKSAERGNEPYYPILTEENIRRNQEYLEALSVFPNLYPCGRLADYKYYDMDDAIVRAFEVFETLKHTAFEKDSHLRIERDT